MAAPAPAYPYQLHNVGPLTTTFTGPSTCLATTTAAHLGDAGFYVAAFWDDVKECYPSGTRPLLLHSTYLYSPGICPSGWGPVISLGTGVPTTLPDYSIFTLGRETTAWLCCPSCAGLSPHLENVQT